MTNKYLEKVAESRHLLKGLVSANWQENAMRKDKGLGPRRRGADAVQNEAGAFARKAGGVIAGSILGTLGAVAANRKHIRKFSRAAKNHAINRLMGQETTPLRFNRINRVAGKRLDLLARRSRIGQLTGASLGLAAAVHRQGNVAQQRTDRAAKKLGK